MLGDEQPRLVLDQREYYLALGSLDDVLQGVYGGPAEYQSPSLWWPDDRAWFVATGVDLAYTDLGGTRACIEAVAGHTGIETVSASLTDRIAWNSDKVNPAVGPPP
jgi:hypothetical protein